MVGWRTYVPMPARPSRIPLLLVPALLAPGPLSAQAAAEVDRLLAPFSAGNSPGATILIIQDGRVLLKKGYGLADLRTRAPIGPETPFLLGSLSKAFTAMAVMILAERGRLGYDDPLSKHLPEFHGAAGQVSLRQLLHHTGGFPEFEALLLANGQIGFDWPRSASGPSSPIEPTSQDVLALLAQVRDLRFAPGTKWEYSNSGYVILAQVVERISGRPFPRFLQDEVFKPLGMERTVVANQTRPSIPGAATGYTLENGAYRDIDYAPHRSVYGHCNIYSTLEDLYRWDQALQSERLVSATTLKVAFSPGHLRDGTPTSYGFGWRLGRRAGFDAVEHGGSFVGFRAVILRIPERRFTAIALSNLARFDLGRFVDTIDRAYLRSLSPLTASSAEPTVIPDIDPKGGPP